MSNPRFSVPGSMRQPRINVAMRPALRCKVAVIRPVPGSSVSVPGLIAVQTRLDRCKTLSEIYMALRIERTEGSPWSGASANIAESCR